VKGWRAIEKNMADLDDAMKQSIRQKIDRIKNGERDLYY